ncbi:GNAT family N-acetyltransferase [Kribbella soli]|uniref:N-acetyltransferase n=1 Tax=Kribbella soli TaxID=1124743 RepID=A0A4R0HCS0_9ACTN|nr:GNAT family N-acetyltransferase [Kribbella soli]TCC07748.1 N-acetyltransferase [Kribbella soli]
MKTIAPLPGGYTVRPAERADAEALFDMLAAYNQTVFGYADTTLQEVAYCIDRPGFDRMIDGWLVLAADGLPAGYATTLGTGDRQLIDIEVAAKDPAVTAWLVDRTMERAQEMGRERGHAEVTVDAFVCRADESLRAQLSGHDFTTGTTFHRMRIDHTGPAASPDGPAGVEVRRGAFDEATRWAAHEAINECFRGQFGWVETPHEDWLERHDDVPIFEWAQLTLLEVEGQVVAVRECNDKYVETENCGHIGMLGVVEEFRGRGLAKFLLRDAFALDAATGRAGTILHVDTNNPTPALGLYLSVGMNPTVVFDGWRRVVPVTEPPR